MNKKYDVKTESHKGYSSKKNGTRLVPARCGSYTSPKRQQGIRVARRTYSEEMKKTHAAYTRYLNQEEIGNNIAIDFLKTLVENKI
jgi:hypothetical protein